MEEKKKQERKVIHLQMGEVHEYFGSISQLFKKYDADVLGISYYQVKNRLANSGMMQTDKCIIRIGWLQTSLRQV